MDDQEKQQMMIDRISETDGVVPRFPLLSDPDHAVIDRYGLFNEDGAMGPIPHPATYVIDRKGVVRYRFVEVDYKVRPSNEDVMEVLQALE